MYKSLGADYKNNKESNSKDSVLDANINNRLKIIFLY